VPGSGQLPAGPAVDRLARQVGVAVVAGRYLPPWASASRAATPRRPATAAVSSWSSIAALSRSGGHRFAEAARFL